MPYSIRVSSAANNSTWYTFAANTLACADLGAPLYSGTSTNTNGPYVLLSCSTEPVALNTVLSVKQTNPSTGAVSFSSRPLLEVSALSVDFSSSSSTVADQIAAIKTDVSTLKTQYSAVQNVLSGQANPDVIQAQMTIFGVVLGAAALIWGMRKVLQQFSTFHTGES